MIATYEYDGPAFDYGYDKDGNALPSNNFISGNVTAVVELTDLPNDYSGWVVMAQTARFPNDPPVNWITGTGFISIGALNQTVNQSFAINGPTIYAYSGGIYQGEFYFLDGVIKEWEISASINALNPINELFTLSYSGGSDGIWNWNGNLETEGVIRGRGVWTSGTPLEIAVPTSATVGLNQATPISSVSISESGNTTGETFTVTLADAKGDLSATATGGGDVVPGSGTTSLAITGSLTQVNSDLATLTDTDGVTPSDTITIAASDSLGNNASPQTIAVTVTQALSLRVNDTDIGAAAASAVAFTIAGLGPQDTGTVTFTDKNNQIVQISVNGSQTSYAANLSALADGVITSSLAVDSFSPVAGNLATLDQDLGEQAALNLTVLDTAIRVEAASAVPFTIAGLDSEDTGTVTFTDANNKTVPISVNGTQTSYTANLTTLAA
jgi:hypothetical protein